MGGKKKGEKDGSKPEATLKAGEPGTGPGSVKKAKQKYVAYMRETLAAPESKYDTGTDFRGMFLKAKNYNEVRVIFRAHKVSI